MIVTSEEDSDSYVEGISAQLPNSPPPIGDAPQSANRQQTPGLQKNLNPRLHYYSLLINTTDNTANEY